MAWFYNFNFDEGKMYCMPIADMFTAHKHRRNIVINKEDDTIPRTTNPYVEGHVTYKVHEFPEVVYKRCFWMEERDDKKAEEIKNKYLEARAKEEAEKCHYCDDSCKDIFYAEFDNSEVSVFINEDATLELYISGQGDEYKKIVPIKRCPFCGRRLRND